MKKTEWNWMIAASSVYGVSNELILWAHKTIYAGDINTPGGVNHWGVPPDWGRAAVHLFFSVDGQPPFPLGNDVFAHEAGHALGLGHPYEEPEFRDPKDLTARTASDVWDLVYKPPPPGAGGTAATFYNSRAEAEAAGGSLSAIQKVNPANCTVPNGLTGTMECTVEGVVYHSGDPQIKGLGFQFGLNNGTNLMGGPTEASPHLGASSSGAA